MDGSRTADLDLFRRRMEDDTLSAPQRRQAANHFYVIQRQTRDRTLAELRRRLVNAHKQNDEYWVEHYQRRIKAHSFRMGYEKPEGDSFEA